MVRILQKKNTERFDFRLNKISLAGKQFKSKKCVRCGANVRGIEISVTYNVGFIIENYNLHGCQCLKCNRKYISRAAYNAFINDTKAENIATKFIFNQME